MNQKRIIDVPAGASLQAVLDALPHGEAAHLRLAPGCYTGVLTISRPGITLEGVGVDPTEVVIACDHHHGGINPATGQKWGTTGSASVFVLGDDFRACNLTFANTWAGHDPDGANQAVAVKTEGDRLIFERCRFIGRQDTLYANTPAPTRIARQYFRECEIEGDIDFIFGRATAVFDRCLIRAVTDRVNQGYLTAPSTWEGNPRGFLFQSCRFESDAAAATFALGRPWAADKDGQHPRGTISNGQMLVRQCWLGAHVGPWVDFAGPAPCRVDPQRLLAYANSGPGATVDHGPEPGAYGMADYLRGVDGWAPDGL